MGIKGSGVAGVAKLASKMGYEVTGCDLEDGGHSLDHLKGVDLLVVTPAVFWQSKSEPELLQAKKVMTWQEFLGKVLLKDKKVIAVAGTHGKSTTTAMAAKLLTDCGYDPIAVAGAFVPEWKGNSRFGRGEYAVVEADEFNDNFLNYLPEIAIVTNIEFDHPDYFKDEAQVRESFEKFKGQSKFVIDTYPQKNFNLKIWGEHNQRNASMVYALGRKLGISDEEIVKSLESYTGIGRRMEFLGKTASGAFVYDDYAHHPTAIKTTLEGLRKEFPEERIWTVVEAHGYKRTNALLPKYEDVFDNADILVVGPIFKARDAETFGITEESIVKASKHKNAKAFSNLNKMLDFIKENLKAGDIVLVMGAGKSNIWATKVLKI